ncbi:TIGR01777 family oxidoreductase [Mucilaginibacter koreensis]
MKYQKIILAGGNGYLGTVLSHYYSDKAKQIIILSRKPKTAEGNVKTLVWDGRTIGAWAAEMEGADMLINLCGKNVNCRYTPENKREILDSRLEPTGLLGKVIAQLKQAPKLWINVTSATIYRHAEDRPQDEAHGEIGEGFSVNICRQWEKVFFDAHTPNTPKVALRMGIVLGESDGVFPRLHNLVKFGLGGKQGNGKQYVAWIHEHDAACITEWLLQHPEAEGVYNCTAPMPVQNKVLMQNLRRLAGAPLGLPAPKWMLEIGALLIGTETELILKSRWVVPTRLTNAGYRFTHPLIDGALKDILHK